ncbi:MAG TPA: 3-phosphoshikimate 1-carboxyvinyltransferase [Bacteroidales bacterium]|jgi:3-phosphoshikimate 1-carboxyvinyltransferase|nr:3-phosphoshikimate 1-carboxyvinyltransferase [Bacteroidales bacterium]MDI9532214.1 3-phosphoshikimate 1-carboxyvinyltransferase [Bacteroidota bacterium]OPZ57541.1 MAG: 3-phosphoshikimate 1-carboxyvinyltransferase [Bacteroidetes bacterium ADurb.BinA012]MBP7036623.1 3-phosphoshikimate 1-carboxyvinyltransferase [Bacteroidales bacterium]MBP8708787.1 3-phosphoshikimate 1-carboxyvinyltransferase [Bacteroidales bacterium]
MNITISPSGISGTIEAPASKSLTQRAIAAGLLAEGSTVILNPAYCNDSLAAVAMAGELGASVHSEPDRIIIESRRKPTGAVTLNCSESGLALRMFAPISAIITESVKLEGQGSLMRRPVAMIGQALSQLGVTVEATDGRLPLKLTGRLRPGRAFVDGSAGSQLLTGLLMALPLADGESRIDVAGLTSKPYIRLTLSLLAEFGITVENDSFRTFIIPGNQSYRAHEYTVEGDWSSAAFLLVAGAMAGRVTVNGLNLHSVQADRAILTVLNDAGAALFAAPDAVTSSLSGLHSFTFDATDSPDLFPPLAALAAGCEGTSSIRGVSRLRHKESDRAVAIADVLEAMKIRVKISGDEMLITGGRVQGAVVSSHNDHRIAMMASVMAASATAPVTVAGAEAVAKSYPGFYNDMGRLGAVIF